jgi:predicted RNase H-like HicB family nuclease
VDRGSRFAHYLRKAPWPISSELAVVVRGKPMAKLRMDLRAVFYKEGDYWIAHCLEMDVMGHGHTRKQAFLRMNDAICTQIERSVDHDNLDNISMPADARFFQMYFAGKNRATGWLTLHTPSTKGRSDAPCKLDDIVFQAVKAREYTGDYAIA